MNSEGITKCAIAVVTLDGELRRHPRGPQDPKFAPSFFNLAASRTGGIWYVLACIIAYRSHHILAGTASGTAIMATLQQLLLLELILRTARSFGGT